MPQRFEGQAAVVTGGADGLGRAIAHRLAQEGAAVTLMDHDADKLAQTQAAFAQDDIEAHTATADVSDDHAVAEALRGAAERHGRLDIAVHCAGIVGPNGKPITEVDIEDFDRVMAVNLRGSFSVVKHALPPMLAQDYGRILLFASIAGKDGNAGMCAYSATKAGVIGLVKAVGKEHAETGVTINAVAPAVIRTALVDAMDPAQVTYMTDKIPAKRCGTLEETAALAAWIVSPEASFNTGFTFDLSGGRAVY
ncbi:MAG: SDR family NAD(P)-dependent oxidoreductase [Planctomycetota bacterium]